MKWVKKLVPLLIVFLLPLVVLTLSANLVVRMPDFYQYEFNQNHTADELRLGIKDSDLADFFSSYMWGREAELVLMTDTDTEEEQNIFLPAEQESMGHFRTIMNLLSLAGAVLFLPVAAGYFALIRWDEKEALRRSFLASVPVLLAFGILCKLCIWNEKAAQAVRDAFFGQTFPADGVLEAVFTPQFILHGAAAAAAIAAITYIIASMVTWSISKPYRMFSGRRERPDRP